MLKAIIDDKYRSVISLGLTTISQGQLEEAFRAFNISGSTLLRAIRFFVKACEELGIQISTRISAKTHGAGAAAPRKRKSSNGAKREDGGHAPLKTDPTAKALEDKLLDKFPPFDPSWPDALKTKWFEGFERLMKSSLGE